MLPVAAIVIGALLILISGGTYIWMTIKTNQLRAVDDQRDLFLQHPGKLFQVLSEYQKQTRGAILPAVTMVAFSVGFFIAVLGYSHLH